MRNPNGRKFPRPNMMDSRRFTDTFKAVTAPVVSDLEQWVGAWRVPLARAPWHMKVGTCSYGISSVFKTLRVIVKCVRAKLFPQRLLGSCPKKRSQGHQAARRTQMDSVTPSGGSQPPSSGIWRPPMPTDPSSDEPLPEQPPSLANPDGGVTGESPDEKHVRPKMRRDRKRSK